jgi:hypothetical protein
LSRNVNSRNWYVVVYIEARAFAENSNVFATKMRRVSRWRSVFLAKLQRRCFDYFPPVIKRVTERPCIRYFRYVRLDLFFKFLRSTPRTACKILFFISAASKQKWIFWLNILPYWAQKNPISYIIIHCTIFSYSYWLKAYR